jgi:hypothetical protein
MSWDMILQMVHWRDTTYREDKAAEKVPIRGETLPSAAKAEFISKQLRTA